MLSESPERKSDGNTMHICLEGKKQVWPCKEDNEQREGDGERLERAGSGRTTPGSDLIDSGVEQLERHRLPFSHRALNLDSAAKVDPVNQQLSVKYIFNGSNF